MAKETTMVVISDKNEMLQRLLGLHYVSCTVWKYRNEKTCGINRQEEDEKKKEQQKKLIDKLFKKRSKYNIIDELQLNLFKMGCKKQKVQSSTANENWIELAKMIFKTSQQRNGNEKITNWLNRNNTHQVQQKEVIMPM